MWKKIVGIYLAIGGILSTYVIGSELSRYTQNGWVTTIITWCFMALISLPLVIWLTIRSLIKHVK